MHPKALKLLHSPFWFSVHTFSENFSPNEPELTKSLNIPKWTGGSQKGGGPLMAPKMLHSPFCFSIHTFSEMFSPNGPVLPKLDINKATNWVWTGCVPNGGNGPLWLQRCYIPDFIFYCAPFLKISAQTDQNCQSWILMSKLGKMAQKWCDHPILVQIQRVSLSKFQKKC